MPIRTKSALLMDLTGEPPRPNVRTECGLIEKINARSEEERKAIFACIDNPKWTSRSLAGVLTKRGVTASAGAVQNHRNGTCPCYRNREAEK